MYTQDTEREREREGGRERERNRKTQINRKTEIQTQTDRDRERVKISHPSALALSHSHTIPSPIPSTVDTFGIDYRGVARHMRLRAAHTTHPRGSCCTTQSPPNPCMCRMNRRCRSRHLGPYSRHCTGSRRRSRSRPATRSLP